MNVPPGTYTVRAERIGMGTVTRQITISEGEVLEENFQLQGSAAVSDSALAALRQGTDLDPMVRLRTMSNDPERRPIIIIDGVRISPEASESILNQTPSSDIERIEVVSGSAATTLYGPQAVNGVIHIFKKKP
jgi:outer membrane receptor for ferrienterochelin and colicin